MGHVNFEFLVMKNNSNYLFFFSLLIFIEAVYFCIAQTGLQPMSRMPRPLSAGITGLYHPPCFLFV